MLCSFFHQPQSYLERFSLDSDKIEIHLSLDFLSFLYSFLVLSFFPLSLLPFLFLSLLPPPLPFLSFNLVLIHLEVCLPYGVRNGSNYMVSD